MFRRIIKRIFKKRIMNSLSTFFFFPFWCWSVFTATYRCLDSRCVVGWKLFILRNLVYFISVHLRLKINQITGVSFWIPLHWKPESCRIIRHIHFLILMCISLKITLKRYILFLTSSSCADCSSTYWTSSFRCCHTSWLLSNAFLLNIFRFYDAFH